MEERGTRRFAYFVMKVERIRNISQSTLGIVTAFTIIRFILGDCNQIQSEMNPYILSVFLLIQILMYAGIIVLYDYVRSHRNYLLSKIEKYGFYVDEDYFGKIQQMEPKCITINHNKINKIFEFEKTINDVDGLIDHESKKVMITEKDFKKGSYYEFEKTRHR